MCVGVCRCVYNIYNVRFPGRGPPAVAAAVVVVPAWCFLKFVFWGVCVCSLLKKVRFWLLLPDLPTKRQKK